MGEVFKGAFFDALSDSLSIVPFLFIIFLLIEIFEHFYFGKILSFLKFSSAPKAGFKAKAGPLIGAVLASIPQCGLSVIASAIYARRLITRGTLIAVYIGTSDEAIPVLMSNPAGAKDVLPLILTKTVAAVFAGYLVDMLFKESIVKGDFKEEDEDIESHKGCHSHNIVKTQKEPLFSKIKVLILHPFVHTLSVTFFVFIITFLINILFSGIFAGGVLNNAAVSVLFGGKGPVGEFLQTVSASIFGIIPNCAVSVGITVMYLKGTISFASCISGLSAGAGLGILVLIKKNEDKKDTVFIIGLLLILSILAGVLAGFCKMTFGAFGLLGG